MNETSRTGYSVEGLLDTMGILFILFSIAGIIASIYLSQEDSMKQSGLSIMWIGIGLAFFAQGVICWVICKSGSEIIKLLKKLNGIEYNGAISGDSADEIFVCPDCGVEVSEDAKDCSQCGAVFDEKE